MPLSHCPHVTSVSWEWMMHLQMETLFTVCFLLVHLYYIKPFFSLSHLFSLSQYRALFCQRCGVGTSYLLLLQRDSHGVQLPGEGIEVILMKTYPSELSVFTLRSCWSIQSIFWKDCGCECVVKRQHHESRFRSNTSLLLLFECQYQLFSKIYTDLSSSYLFVCISDPTNPGLS